MPEGEAWGYVMAYAAATEPPAGGGKTYTVKRKKKGTAK
jgi:hypothetical protein